jgi:tetratricopeptide (TPR) repeat protein
MIRPTVLAGTTIAIVLLSFSTSTFTATATAAEPNGVAVREAAKHFQRGVTLYSEADYPGALVEFKRAYALAPNDVVLYNIGETQYQLRDYAGALGNFERYLAESAPTDPRRAQVESSVKVLRSRVGELTVVTLPVGAEVSVNDRVVGKTPLERPLIVSVGHLKVSASAPNRQPVARYVEVAAEDRVSVTLELPVAAIARATMPLATRGPADIMAPSITTDMLAHQPADDLAASSRNAAAWRTAGWIATGTLAVGAVACGLMARKESNDLKTERARFPPNAGKLDHLSKLTTTFSVLADSLGAAALVVGGLTLYSTVASHKEASSSRIVLGPASMRLEVTF